MIPLYEPVLLLCLPKKWPILPWAGISDTRGLCFQLQQCTSGVITWLTGWLCSYSSLRWSPHSAQFYSGVWPHLHESRWPFGGWVPVADEFQTSQGINCFPYFVAHDISNPIIHFLYSLSHHFLSQPTLMFNKSCAIPAAITSCTGACLHPRPLGLSTGSLCFWERLPHCSCQERCWLPSLPVPGSPCSWRWSCHFAE